MIKFYVFGNKETGVKLVQKWDLQKDLIIDFYETRESIEYESFKWVSDVIYQIELKRAKSLFQCYERESLKAE